MKELKDTVKTMISEDYKERFQAEYDQLSIRIAKLVMFLDRYEQDKLDFKPSFPIELLRLQLDHMNDYKKILKIRAGIEGVPVEEVDLTSVM